jgi:hypothetical protein
MRGNLVSGRFTALLAALLVMLALAACGGKTQETAVDADEPSEDSAAAVLEAYRNYGGEVLPLSNENPMLTGEVKDLQGTVPAYDLTGGNPPCTGFLRPIPSLVFTLADGAKGINVSFAGNALSTLIVVEEGEDIVCDPSAPPALKTSLKLENPAAGRYGVWVGRADTQVQLDGTIAVSLVQ